ncbi:MAG: DNA polymerase III subunit delta' C-terminal domain-containing protein, partial [Chloroflexota bacterium]
EVSGRGKTTLKIDQIRELQQELNLAAYEAHWKVAILRQFETATPGAANAFLKTLEEPPAGVVLLLTAADADTLLPTIRSRCRIITLRPLSVELVERSLAGRWHVPPDKAHLLAHLSGGRLGWAVQAAADPSLLETRAAHLAALQTALRGRRVARFSLAAKLAEDAEALPPVLQTWQSWWRDLALLVQGEGGSLTNVDQQAELEELAYRWRPEQVLASLKQTREALGQLERNANTRLVMECLFLFYPY